MQREKQETKGMAKGKQTQMMKLNLKQKRDSIKPQPTKSGGFKMRN